MKLPEYKELQDKGDYFDNYVIETPKKILKPSIVILPKRKV